MVHITLRGPPCPRHDGPAPVRPVVGLDERLKPRCAGRPQAPELWVCWASVPGDSTWLTGVGNERDGAASAAQATGQ